MVKKTIGTRKIDANNCVRRAEHHCYAHRKTRIALGFSEEGNLKIVRATNEIPEIDKKLIRKYVTAYNHFEIDEDSLFKVIRRLGYEIDTYYLHDCEESLTDLIKNCKLGFEKHPNRSY